MPGLRCFRELCVGLLCIKTIEVIHIRAEIGLLGAQFKLICQCVCLFKAQQRPHPIFGRQQPPFHLRADSGIRGLRAQLHPRSVLQLAYEVVARHGRGPEGQIPIQRVFPIQQRHGHHTNPTVIHAEAEGHTRLTDQQAERLIVHIEKQSVRRIGFIELHTLERIGVNTDTSRPLSKFD